MVYDVLKRVINEMEKRDNITLKEIFEELRNNNSIDWEAIKECEKTEPVNWMRIEKKWKWYVIRRFVSPGLFLRGGDRISKLCGTKAVVAKQIEDFVINTNNEMEEGVVADAALQSISKRFDLQNPTVENQASFTNFVRTLTIDFIRRRRNLTTTNDTDEVFEQKVEELEIIERTSVSTTVSELPQSLTSTDCRMVLVEREKTAQEQTKMEYLKEFTATLRTLVRWMFRYHLIINHPIMTKVVVRKWVCNY